MTGVQTCALPIFTDHLTQVVSMLEVLGLSFALADQVVDPAFAEKVEALIALRNSAKNAKDFATADSIRDELQQLGVTIKDLPDRTIWSING